MTKGLANEFVVGNVRYAENAGSTSVTVVGPASSGVTGDIIIPETVSYGGGVFLVTKIREHAFRSCTSLTGNLTIGNNVTTIGEGAFESCRGFTGCLTIGVSVTTIGKSVFKDCSGFSEVHFNATNVISSPDASTGFDKCAFFHCAGALSIGSNVERIPHFMFAYANFMGSLNIPNSVTEIGNYAFYGCSGFNGTLTLPDNALFTKIESETFNYCSGFIGNLMIPNSVTEIGYGAFNCCSGFNGTLTLPNNVLFTKIESYTFYSCSGFTGTLTIPNSVTSIGEGAFCNCSGFTGSLMIGNSVTSIGGSAFYNCSGFTGSLTIGNSVTSISGYAFYNCSGFTGSLTIGNSVTSISGNAFYDCSGFTGSLTIPNSVTSIGSEAFRNCSGFTGNLIIGDSVTTIGNYAFHSCSGFTGSLTIPNSVTTIGQSAFYGCSGFTGTLTIPNSVTTIGQWAFYNCSGLTEVIYNATNCADISSSNYHYYSPFLNCVGMLTIGENVERIPAYMFYNCDGFTGSLTIPNSVTSIGNYAFSDCSSFTGNLTIGNSVTTIGNFAFQNCSGLNAVYYTGNIHQWCNIQFGNYCSNPLCYAHNLYIDNVLVTNLVIPETVTEIKPYAFYSATCLNSLTIPHSVASIGNSAFYNCSSVTEVHYNATNCADSNSPFSGCGGILTIGNNVERIPAYMFYNCSFTGNLTIPNSVTSIGNYAFKGCSGFTGNLSIGNSVTSIGSEAFRNCSGFTGSLTIPNSIIEIGGSAFNGCSGFTDDLVIPNSVTSIGNYAFYGCSGLTSIYSYGAVPPAAGNSAFQSINYSIPVHIPICSASDYSEATQWNNFTNYQATLPCLPTFTGNGTDNLWSNPDNWHTLPNNDYDIVINANCEMDEDVETSGVIINNIGTLVIKSGHVLTINGNAGKSNNTLEGEIVNHGTAANLIIEDGGQLVHNQGGLQGTVQKAVLPYAQEGNNGWHLINLPLANNLPVASVVNVFNENYDLYYYDEPTHYWMNQKFVENNFTEMEAGKGYLYANSEEVTLAFAGELLNGSALVNVPLSYTSTAGGLKGFNLVGNPFVHNVITYASINVANGCYRMNEAKDNLIVSEITETEPLKPAEGFFVKATDENASIIFNPGRGETTNRSSSIWVELLDNGKLIDRLIVKKDGQSMEKLSLNNQRTKLFAMQDHQEMAIVSCEGNEQPVNFKAAKNGTYIINVNANGLEFNYLHLIDNLTGADVDLLQTPTYNFTAKTTDYASRFRLVFSACGDAYSDNEAFAYYNGSEWVVANGENATLQIVDTMGRIVYCRGGVHTVSTNGMAPGVYTLRLINGDDVKTQKIIIE